MNKLLLVTSVAAFALLSACSKDDDNPSPSTPAFGEVEVKIDHTWGMGSAPFAVGTQYTHPATGEQITFTALRYFVSNIRLVRPDGSEWAQPESYYIVNAANSHNHLHVESVPAGDYVGIKYTIGVDSTRNVSGAQTGALDPAAPGTPGFWSWSTGYIFVRAEGTSPAAPNNTFSYHLGGFDGDRNAIREVEHSFGGAVMRVAPNATPSVHIYANAARFWHGGISLSNLHTVHMPGSNAVLLSENFAGGFRFDHLHN
jgi:hypothetical protein